MLIGLSLRSALDFLTSSFERRQGSVSNIFIRESIKSGASFLMELDNDTQCTISDAWATSYCSKIEGQKSFAVNNGL